MISDELYIAARYGQKVNLRLLNGEILTGKLNYQGIYAELRYERMRGQLGTLCGHRYGWKNVSLNIENPASI